MSQTQRRKVSVIIPTRNRADLLRDALKSIRAIEAEGDDLEFEILVGDNGDRDAGAKEVAGEFGAIYMATTVAGSSATRNLGLERATGEFITFLDDDDLWISGHIRPHIKFLDENPDYDGVVAQVIPTDPDRKPQTEPMPVEHPGNGDDLLRRMLSGYFPQIGTCVCRGNARSAYGLFDLALLGGQDLDWMLRIAGASKLAFLQMPAVYVRVRPPGSYDELNKKRVGFDRKVFFRHAPRSPRIWGSPVEVLRAYTGTLKHFYAYFRDAMEERAESGDAKGARSAFWGAMKVFPMRVVKSIFVHPRFRRAVFTAFGLSRARTANA